MADQGEANQQGAAAEHDVSAEGRGAEPGPSEDMSQQAEEAGEALASLVEPAVSWIPEELRPWAVAGGTLVLALLVAWIVHMAVFAALRRVARRKESALSESIVKRFRGPARLLLILVAFLIATPIFPLYDGAQSLLRRLLSIGLIAAAAWLLVRISDSIESLVRNRYDITAMDNLRARQVHTQMQVITRVLDVVIVVVAIAVALMTFDGVRQLGASILASAGIAGIVVGLAARPVLSNIIAGIQIALAEPIRLDDVVIVEGEWGRIEEITATYVVVRIWDERRLIVPLSYFLENVFQNWTRESAQLLGTVFLYTDYTVPVDSIREELNRITKDSENWDERVSLVQVTDNTAENVQVRALVSSSDAGKLWNLRCEVREKLIHYIQKEHPEALPVTRAELRESTQMRVKAGTPEEGPPAGSAEQATGEGE